MRRERETHKNKKKGEIKKTVSILISSTLITAILVIGYVVRYVLIEDHIELMKD